MSTRFKRKLPDNTVRTEKVWHYNETVLVALHNNRLSGITSDDLPHVPQLGTNVHRLQDRRGIKIKKVRGKASQTGRKNGVRYILDEAIDILPSEEDNDDKAS